MTTARKVLESQAGVNYRTIQDHYGNSAGGSCKEIMNIPARIAGKNEQGLCPPEQQNAYILGRYYYEFLLEKNPPPPFPVHKAANFVIEEFVPAYQAFETQLHNTVTVPEELEGFASLQTEIAAQRASNGTSSSGHPNNLWNEQKQGNTQNPAGSQVTAPPVSDTSPAPSLPRSNSFSRSNG